MKTLIASLGMIVCAAACARDEAKTPAQPAPKSAEAEKWSGPYALALDPIPTPSSMVDREIGKLQDAAKRTPEKADHWILLGRAFVQKARQSHDPGFYLSADAAAEIALQKKPGYALALALRGLVLLNSHRFAKARDVAQEALAQDPDDLIALGVLSDALLELGDIDGATNAADKMMSLKPNLPSYARVAHLFWLHGNFEEAKKSYRLAIDVGMGGSDPEAAAWVLTETAKIFQLKGDYAGAEAGFDRALQVLPDFPTALLGKARSAIAGGRFDEAARLAKRSFEVSHLPEAAWLWGDASGAAGRADDAEKAYAEVVRTGQNDKRALAAFYATEGREVELALRIAEEEIATRGDIYTLDAHAWALYRAKRFDEAQKASDRALRLGTKDPTLIYHAGAIAIARGDLAGGVKKIEEALAMAPHFQLTGAREARALLAEHRSLQAKK